MYSMLNSGKNIHKCWAKVKKLIYATYIYQINILGESVIIWFRIVNINFEFTYLIGKNLKKNKEESSNVAVQDPKGAAMAQLGLNLNKTTRNLRKEDIDVAFIQKMHDSEYS